MRNGKWQEDFTEGLAGKTLGVIGLGRIGAAVAGIGGAFGMRVIAWSQNLGAEACIAAGAELVSKEELFRSADVVTIHSKLSDRTRHLVNYREFELMKDSAILVNTARGAIVNEQALLAALRNRNIASAALEVFETEPLPQNHPLRSLDNVVLTPHVSFVVRENFELVYGDALQAIKDWLDG
jgi:phosphoglycerate dehydrogenase-like enzyme